MTQALVENDDIPLRVLLVEDSQQDAELILLYLQRGGFIPAWQRVDTEEAMRAELDNGVWDIILSDFTMPHFSGDQALEVANSMSPDTPLIVVSGNVGEEQAASLMRDGARDYVRKSNLARLAPTVIRELEEAAIRQESRKLKEILDNITGVLLPLTGNEFFESLVKVLADSVDMNSVKVCTVDTENRQVTAIACCANGKICKSAGEHDYSDPIISEIINKGMLSIANNLQSQFNPGEGLSYEEIESCIGYSLLSTKGQVIGLLLLFDDKPLSNIHTINSVVKLCSVRATAELERTINEQRLQESEKQMRDILRNMQDTLFRISIDNCIQWISPSVKDLLGYESDKIIGEIFENYFTSRIPEQNLLAMLHNNNGKLSSVEVPLLHKDGSVVWVSVNAQYYYIDNKVAGVEGVARNITQQRLAEIALRQSEELFSKAFHASPAMIALSQLHENYELGVFIDVNEAFLERCGYARDEVVGKTVDEIEFFTNHRDHMELVNQLRAKGYGRDIEFPFKAKNAEIYYALGSIETIDIAGSVCALWVFQDITFRRKAQKELERHREHLEELVEQRTTELSEAVHNLETEVQERRQIEQALVEATTRAQSASKAKSEFLANMSHELRTPLNSIIGFTELLMLEPEDVITIDNREKLSYVLDSAWHLLSLINDILDLSKIEAGKMELNLSLFSLDKLLASISSLFKERVDKQKISLTTENLASGESVYADERKLKQVLFNLVSNAVKFTPESGSITISMSLVSLDEFESLCGCPDALQTIHSRFLGVSVTDTGIGISEEDAQELFKPFRQLDSSVTRKYEGTGLGLHLCRQMIELHGGCIAVESEPGRGSCFRFIIPCGGSQTAA